MKLSLNWLRDLLPDLPKDIKTEDLVSNITMKLAEVEGVVDQAASYENIVVGKVKNLKKHPGADRLQLVDTDIGGKTVQVVCGGTNLYKDQFVAVGLPGAHVRWHGEGDLVEIKETKIRGEKSFGMICAPAEIGFEHLQGAEHEILDLKDFKAKKAGVNLAELMGLDDIILDIDNHSITHRPDLWGHLGWAFELAAIFGVKPPKIPDLKFEVSKKSQFKAKISAKDHCQRFSGAVISGVEGSESPDWLKQRLLNVGLRPISLLVDVTNFVMYEVGQPMHAYDVDKLPSKTVDVRMAKKKEKLTTLDEAERVLSEDMLVISFGDKGEGLGGVMGGFDSMIDEKTDKVLLEAANFHPRTIRRTSIELGLRSDASARFEKTLQVESTVVASTLSYLYVLPATTTLTGGFLSS